MRTAGLSLGLVLSLVSTPAAQPPLGSLAPAAGPVHGAKTVVPALVACTDIPTTTPPASTLRILAPHTGDFHLASTRRELVVLNGGTAQGFAIGQRYFTRRYTPPSTRELMTVTDHGAIRTTGWLTVVAADERFALARVDYACVSVEAGDYLEPYEEPVLPTVSAPDGPTNFADLGKVLFGVDRHEAFGAGDLLSIDRGSARGMAVGTRVAFYRDRGNGTPLVEIGVGVVIEVSADASKVVLDRTYPDVRMGDYFGVRTAP